MIPSASKSISLAARAAAVLSVFLLAPPLAAQTSFSTVRGTATDQTGAIVPGVNVTVTDVQTNIQRSAVTNQTGNFEIPDLKQGTYRLQAQAAGFKTFVAEELILESSQIRRVDVPLQVGEAASEVTVNASAAVINVEESKISSTVTVKTYQESPQSGIDRFNPTMLLMMLPSVQPTVGGGNDFSISGVGGSQIEEGMDGAVTQGSVNQIHNMEDVEEVKVVTINNSAEYPRAGYFNLVGKRGYNAFHGTAVYYFQNSALNARSFFDPERAPLKFHIFGASASGRIIKDKTFFYTSWNGIRDLSKNYFLTNAPTSKMRTGDFSELLSQPRPTIVRDPLNNTPFPNNVIPSARLNALPLKVQEQYIPSPNRGGQGDLNNNLSILHPYPFDLFKVDYFSVRLDHEFSAKNHFFGRIENRWTPYVLPRTWPGLAWTRNRYAWHQVISDTHVFSPNLVQTLRFGWYLNRVVDGNEVDGFKPVKGDQVVKELGLQGVNPQNLSAMGFPAMNITGFVGLSTQPGGVIQDDHDVSFASSTTWSRSKHTLKFGGEYRRYLAFLGSSGDGTYGSFDFNGSLSGFGYSDFLLGLPFSSQRLNVFTNRGRHSSELGLYVEDTYKVTSRITLDLGLRWDYFGPAVFDDGIQYNWDPKTGNVLVPQSALSRVSSLYPRNTITVAPGDAVVHADRRNFAPRLGFAYRLRDKTVLRAGYGIFTEFLGQFRFANAGGPFQLSETFFNSITNGAPLFSFPNPFPAGAGNIPSQSISGFPIDAKNGRIHQFNVTLEHQIGQMGLRASYSGMRARGLNYDLNLNKPAPSNIPFTQLRRPYPQFVSTTYGQANGEINYNAFTLEAQQKIGALTFDAHWTWAHNMLNYLNLENPYSPNLWNRDSVVANQRFVASTYWNVPMGRGRRYLNSASRFVNGVLGDWQMAFILVFQTGNFFSPSFSGADPSNTNTFGGLPDRIRDGNLPRGDRVVSRWFDTAAFAPPPPGRFGNSGVNVLEGPGRNVQDISLSKDFKITERLTFDLMGAATNVFNHPNFLTPNSNVSVPSAGIVTSAYTQFGADRGGARRIELRGRLRW